MSNSTYKAFLPGLHAAFWQLVIAVQAYTEHWELMLRYPCWASVLWLHPLPTSLVLVRVGMSFLALTIEYFEETNKHHCHLFLLSFLWLQLHSVNCIICWVIQKIKLVNSSQQGNYWSYVWYQTDTLVQSKSCLKASWQDITIWTFDTTTNVASCCKW